MLGQPERGFARLARFLRLEPSAAQLRAAIEKSSFAALARQEAERGFNERPETSERFFRKGEAGQWRAALSKEQVADVVAAHGPMMMRFGYVAEECRGCVRVAFDANPPAKQTAAKILSSDRRR